MTFLSAPVALLAAAIAIPALLLLYFLKLRRQRLVVSSTLLWKQAIEDMQVNAPFQKLRRNLLLLLQLILLLLLLLALARPVTLGHSTQDRRVILLIDHSGSMNATDVDPSRLAVARTKALEIVDRLDARSGGAMVVSFARNARVVQPFTTDRGRLRQAIRSITPTDQTGQIDDALRLIEPYAQEAEAAGGTPVAVYILSDGRVQRSPHTAPLALQGAEIHFERIGLSDPDRIDNVGIVSLHARRDDQRPHEVQIYTRLANASSRPVPVTVTLRLDDRITHVQEVVLPPAAAIEDPRQPEQTSEREPGTQALIFSFARQESGLVQLSIDRPDMLAADNQAALRLAPARRLRVLLVTRGNAFLESVIRSVGVRELVTMTPSRYANQRDVDLRRAGWDELDRLANEGFDVIVFDGVSPQRLPPVNSLFFNAAPPLEDLGIARQADEQARAMVILDWLRGHPLMRWVVLDDVVLISPGRLRLPETAQILATSQSGPVMAELTHQGVSYVVTSFDILETFWPLYVSFPVFFDNALRILGNAESAALAWQVGDVAVVPVSDRVREIDYTGPETLMAHVHNERAVLPAFRQAGLYTTAVPQPEPYDRLAVNMMSLQETALLARDTLTIDTMTIEAEAGAGLVRRELAIYLLWAALALLMVEWLVYTRRMHL